MTVKGTVLAEEKGENEAKEEKGEKGENEAKEEKSEQEAKEYEGGHVQVTSLAMVSPKCQ